MNDYKFLEISEHYIIYSVGEKQIFKEDSIIIDCGACVGNFTQPLWDKYHCNFYLYEPDPRNFRQLKYRFSIYPKIKLNRIAISDINDKKVFYTGRFETSSSLLNSHRGLDGNTAIVDCTTLNDILHGFEKVDLLKLDVEGEEIYIIPTLDPIEIKKVGQVIIEFHLQSEIDGYNIEKVNICREWMKKYGFIEVKYESNKGTNKGQEAVYLNEYWTI
jgi:FkbM family methyltransferase